MLVSSAFHIPFVSPLQQRYPHSYSGAYGFCISNDLPEAIYCCQGYRESPQFEVLEIMKQL